MNKLYCDACYGPKGMTHLSSKYCETCITTINEAREHAAREGLDVAAAGRAALLSRVPHPMANKQHPGTPFDRISTTAYEQRINTQPGGLTDPTRGLGR